ncbi:hypothetical protein, partial [Klebsiella pneumoniae]|uniref:hypothetical protein n=1 Tax=Klebsiella pneumoniae TaxID=573 RepID=UPI003745880F
PAFTGKIGAEQRLDVRDKSKAPRSGDVAGRSPGVQGAAATGRPLCAPGAMSDITQTINRERKLR